MRFSRESQMCYVLSFSTIKTWGQWLRFQGKVEKPNFWQHFCNYWMNQIFPGKSGFVSRSAILSCNFMPSFGKILWLVFKKNSGQTDGRTDRGQSIGPTSFVGGSKNNANKWKKHLENWGVIQALVEHVAEGKALQATRKWDLLQGLVERVAEGFSKNNAKKEKNGKLGGSPSSGWTRSRR